MEHQKKVISHITNKFNSGNKKEAISDLLNLIKKNPNIFEYYLLFGKMNLQINNLERAEKTFLFLLDKNKNSLDVLKNLYVVNLKKGNFNEAEKYIIKILKINNHDYSTLRDLGYIKFLQNNFNEALTIYDKIKNKIKNDCFALNIYGLINYNLGKLDLSIVQFKKAIRSEPQYIDSYNNLGKVYFDLEDIDLAFSNFKKAYKLNQNFSKTLVNIGNILSLKDKNIFAILAFEKALKNTDQKNEVFGNMAIAYSRIKDLKNTIKYYNAATKIKDNASLKLSLSYLYIYLNKYSEAWNLFDSRIETSKFFKTKNQKIIDYILKKKQTISKNDKVLVLREQGIGEEILFSSIYLDLIKFSKNVTIETSTKLITLFERSFNKKIFVKDGLFSNNLDNLKFFDVIIFAGSLCKIFRKNKKNFHQQRFLISNPKNDSLFKKTAFINTKKLRVGLSWKSVVSIYGNLKSLDISDFKALFKYDRHIINFQYGSVRKEIKKIESEGFKIHSFKNLDLFNDIEGCASALKNIDVFVTVSNTTAHIAAAIGVKTILICPKLSSTYFYWNNKNNSTLWYENVKILRVSKSINETIIKVDKILEKL